MLFVEDQVKKVTHTHTHAHTETDRQTENPGMLRDERTKRTLAEEVLCHSAEMQCESYAQQTVPPSAPGS